MLFDSIKEDPASPTSNFDLAPSHLLTAPLVSFGLIAANVAVFLGMMFSGISPLTPTIKDLIQWGANYSPLTISGQWWRLATACFLHIGIIHIAMNMFILFQIGPFTERLFGHVRFLVLYMLAGLGGNVLGLYLHPITVAAGASGAIFGVYGGLLGFLLIERGVVPAENAWKIAKSAGIFIIYNLIYGLANPQTDLVAHGGGLVTGFLAGCLLAQPLLPPRHLQSAVRTAATVLCAAVLGFFAMRHLAKSGDAESEWNQQIVTSPSIAVGNKGLLFYSGSASRKDAEQFGQTLSKLGFFSNSKVAILFRKSSDSNVLFFPMRGDDTLSPTFDNFSSKLVNGQTVVTHSIEKRPPQPWDDPKIIASLLLIGPQLASSAGGLPFTIRLVNSKGDLKRDLSVQTTEVAEGIDRVSYSGQATVTDATALANALHAAGYFKNHGALVYLAKQGEATTLSFRLSDGSWNNPRIVVYLSNISRKVASSIGGLPLQVRLIDIDQQVHKKSTIAK